MITVASGLPRSGTSMLMQMLQAAGLGILSDGARAADVDNPKGYFELEATKRLSQDASFLAEARGSVVKIVAPLLTCLPTEYSYRVIFVERDMEEVMDSQRAMMEHCGIDAGSDAIERALARALQKRIEEVKSWLGDSENVQVCYVMHKDLIESPMEASIGIANFLEAAGEKATGLWSEAERGDALSRMANVVDPELYRHRRRPKK